MVYSDNVSVNWSPSIMGLVVESEFILARRDMMSFITYVDEYPPCDFCGGKALADGKTKWGPWANMCSLCWLHNSNHQLGLGKGQLLIRRGDVGIYDDVDTKTLEYLEGLDYV